MFITICLTFYLPASLGKRPHVEGTREAERCARNAEVLPAMLQEVPPGVSERS
jgi:hypothetical protein